jgi:hypothetical protein
VNALIYPASLLVSLDCRVGILNLVGALQSVVLGRSSRSA